MLFELLCCLLVSTWRIDLSISHGEGFLKGISLCSCLSRKVLMFLYFLKDGFAEYGILSWYSFSFGIMHKSRHWFFFFLWFLLRNQLLISCRIPCVWWDVSVFMLMGFSLCLCLHLWMVWLWCFPVWISELLLGLEFLGCIGEFFFNFFKSKLGSFLPSFLKIIFLPLLFSSPFLTPVMHDMYATMMLSYGPLYLFMYCLLFLILHDFN